MDRTQFYEIEVVDNTRELDFLQNGLSGFTMQYPVAYYIVEDADLMRPDIISYKAYGTVKYWWIIAYVNDIFDLFTELYAGKQLTIPNVIDIYNFYKKAKVR